MIQEYLNKLSATSKINSVESHQETEMASNTILVYQEARGELSQK